MASQSEDPPAPQSEIIKVTGTNNPARINAYTDLSLTRRNVSGTLAASDQPPKKSPENSQGDIRPVYASDKAQSIANIAAATANAAVTQPPPAANKWVRGTVNGRRVSRDPYAVNGMVGQSFFNNQSGS